MAKPLNTIVNAAKGMVSIATDSWKTNLEALVERGEISVDEGKNLLSTLEGQVKEGQSELQKFSKNLFKAVSKTEKKDSKLAPTAADYELQNQQIKTLEIKMNLLVKEVFSLRKQLDAPSKTTRTQKAPAKEK